jgi:hypothetical protein
MASIANDPGGRRRILFVAPSGDRKAIRLGKVSLRSAEGVKYRVEQLLEVQLLGRSMEADLTQWVNDLDARMVKKLAAVGLITKPEEKAAATLGTVSESVHRRPRRPETGDEDCARASDSRPGGILRRVARRANDHAR